MPPNLIMIGAMKSATTSLHRYLGFHPGIFVPEPKEIDYFIQERNWDKGRQWYESHFPEAKAVRGESSTSYTQCHRYKDAPGRIRALIPDAKLSYVLRDPIERTVSRYRQRTIQGLEDRAVAEALKKIFRFLEVDDAFYCKEHAEIHKRSVDKRPRNAAGALLDKMPLKRYVNPVTPPAVLRAYTGLTCDDWHL